MSEDIIDVKLALDVGANVLTTTAQFGEPSLTVIAPFVASDVMYSFAIKQYIDDNFGGNEGITDQFTRDIVFKTVISGFTVWLAQTFTGEGVGLLEGTLNALVSYTSSNGVQDILDIK
jgi:hypothetical protein